MKLTGQNVFVTGGSRGIGLALAIELARLGNRVLVCGRSHEALDAARRRCADLEVVRCDLGDPGDCAAGARAALERLGSLDLLVNNAAVLGHYDFTRDADAAARLADEVQTNLVAPFRLAAHLLPALRTRPEAAIVNINSGAAFVPMPAAPGYAATKAAMNSLSRSLRFQLRDTSVKVFQIYPPVVDTDMAQVVPVNGGGRAMRPDALARRIAAGLRRDELEMRIGLSRVSYWASRLAPSLLERRMQRDALAVSTPQPR